MRKIFIATCLVFIGISVFGQAGKSNNIPAPALLKEEAPLAQVRAKKVAVREEGENCFSYTAEEQKDSLVYVIENLLEYGWSGDNARTVVTRYSYDPVKKNEEEKEGRTFFAPRQQMQFINGSYKVEENILIFTPDKVDKHPKRTFKILYNLKTNKVDGLIDENNNKYMPGECLEPIISL